jgi:hypothetical protein
MNAIRTALEQIKRMAETGDFANEGIARMAARALDADDWVSVKNALPDQMGFVLVTNNINAKNSYGNMSHVWLALMVHPQDDGTFAAFAHPSDNRVESITHWMPLHAASSVDSDLVTLLSEQRAAVKLRDGEWWRGYEAALHWIGKSIEDKATPTRNPAAADWAGMSCAGEDMMPLQGDVS